MKNDIEIQDDMACQLKPELLQRVSGIDAGIVAKKLEGVNDISDTIASPGVHIAENKQKIVEPEFEDEESELEQYSNYPD